LEVLKEKKKGRGKDAVKTNLANGGDSKEKGKRVTPSV